MHHTRILSLVVILALSLALAMTTAHAQTTLRYAHPNAPESTPGRFADKFAELVAEKTDGAVRVQVYPSSQLGSAREMIEGAQLGTIDLGHNDFAALASFLPELAVFNVPYLYRDIDHAVKATDPQQSEVLQELNERLKAQSGLEVMSSFLYGIRELTTSNFPVMSPTDLQGKRIRAIPNPVWIAMVEGMGAIPTPVDFAELPTALATGIVDGQENPLTTIYTSRMYEVQNYLIMTDHMYATLAVYANSMSLDRLPNDQRAAVQEAAEEAAAYILSESIAEHDLMLERLQELGMTVITEDDGLDIEAFREAVSSHVLNTFPQWEEYIARIQGIE